MKFRSVIRGSVHHRIDIPQEVAEQMELRKGSFVGVDLVELEDE